ncbi:MAG: outer membrane beta-barrel protein [Hyphomicrobiales bacterium]|nr:outer membrane beta-barrel protein [Hyphomicrobiales bacterium]
MTRLVSNTRLAATFGLLAALAAGPALATDGPDQEKRWTAKGSLGVQYDDNVTTDDIDSTSNKSDVAAVIELGGTYSPAFGDPVGLELGYDFSQSLYQDLTDFNLQTHALSANVDYEVSGLDLGLNYLYARTFLGGDDFLGLHSVTPTVGRLVTDRWYVSLRYNYQNKDFIGAANSGRDSNVNSVTFDNFVFFMDGQAHLSFGYRLEGENAASREYDYLGHFFHLRWRSPLPVQALERWNPRVRAGLRYYIKNFTDVTPSIGTERDDKRATLSLGLSVDLTEHVEAKLDYEHIAAVSNLPSSDFDENVVTLTVGVSF